MARPTADDPLGMRGPDEPEYIAERAAIRRRKERHQARQAYKARVIAEFPWVGSIVLQAAILVVLLLILARLP